jgi:hypothetical protein
VGITPTSGDESPGEPPSPPVNPLYAGKIGAISVVVAIGGTVIFVVFLALDTFQFVATGHESNVFQGIAHGAGAIGLGGLVVTLVKSYIQPRGN